MRVFVTGATGFIGSAVVQDLIKAGHQVLGLSRSDEGAKALTAAGAKVHRGDIYDLDSIRRGAADSDGVLHLAFNHDFSKFQENCETDRKVIATLGEALAGSDRPLVVTSGTALVNPGTLATEDMMPAHGGHPRVASEEATAELAAKGLRASVIRLSPSVHGDGDHGFIHLLINLAREKGISAYVGEGQNRWTAVHRFDAAPLYRLALEKGKAGNHFHGVAEEGISFKDIATVIGKKLNLPVVSKSKDEAAAHFGWFGGFASLDCPASSKKTREQLGWNPTHKTLLADMEQGTYFKS